MTTDLDAFRLKPALQQPNWPDREALEDALRLLRAEPPLVFAGEADRLREMLAGAAAGRAFVLQGGDCAEIFAEVSADRIRNKIRT
ncbi:MAG: 3-deoxy-7-phosphoheptulonate synthase, partial [Bifidobacteriaceae bacterium]|nr:3-deoxy-7-phosphoheptulonate synthase [Bifidobacteriaceae bacterium]